MPTVEELRKREKRGVGHRRRTLHAQAKKKRGGSKARLEATWAHGEGTPPRPSGAKTCGVRIRRRKFKTIKKGTESIIIDISLLRAS